MARQVLPIVGAVVGAYFGAPQLGYAIGSIVGNAIDPETIKGPRLGEAGIQTSAEGVYRPIVYAKGAVMGNVMVRGNRQVKTQRTQQGKGGGPVIEEQRVYWDFGIRICEAPVGVGIGGVPRIWMDEKLVYDVTPDSTILAESAEFAERFRLYVGDEGQMPDPDLEAWMGVGNVPAYRGTAWIMFPHFDLTDRRESIPNFRFEVSNDEIVPYNYLALLHMDEKVFDTSTHLRDEVDPLRWSAGGDLVPAPFPFGVNALEINGLGDVAETTYDFATAIGTAPFCISAWVNVDSSVVGHISDTILGHWFAPGTRSFQMNISRSPGEPFFVALSEDGSNITNIIGDTPVPFDEWVYLAVTRNESGVVKLWQQTSPTLCTEVGTGIFGGSLHSNAGEVPGESWVIGGFDQIPAQNVFRGLIKELVIIVGDPIYTAPFPPPDAPWPNPTSTEGTPIPLSSIVSDLHERAGHTVSQYDVTELTDPIEGLVLADGYTSADAIRTLMAPFFFDASEHDAGSGYKVNYIKRGKPVVAVITDDDILQAPEKSVREDALERPRKLHLDYQNPDIGYAPAKATARRDSPDIRVVGELALQIPVSFSDVNEPAQIADKLLRVAWAEVAGIEDLSLGDDWLELVPTDCIGISRRGQVRRVRLVQEMSDPGEQGYKMIVDRQSAYTSNVTGIPVPPPTPPLPSIVGPTVYAFLDIPALNDNNDRLIWYEAATGQTEAWYGAQTQRKAGADIEFSNSVQFTQNTIMGTLTADIAMASEHYPDTTNVVYVNLFTDDVIESLTEQQFLSEGGSFALENADGSWEVLQYRDADDEGDRDFALSHLARGRLNTGGSFHASGSRFVLLDGVKSVDAVTAWIDTNITTRAVSFGTSPDGATQYVNPYEAKSQTEFPVAHLFLDRDIDTISAQAIPRHRFGTEDSPVQSVNWLGYRWTATDGSNTAAIPDGTSPTISFDATGWSRPITVTVAQLNRFTGPGPIVSEQIA